jgi:hypothetical protein
MLVIWHRVTINTVKGYNAVNNDTNHNSVFKSHIIYDNIATRAEARSLRSKGSIPSRGKGFSLLESIQISCGPRPTSCSVGTGAVYPEVKWLEHENIHSLSLGAEIKYAQSYTSTPPYIFMSSWLIMHRDNFTLTYGKIAGTMDQTYSE